MLRKKGEHYKIKEQQEEKRRMSLIRGRGAMPFKKKSRLLGIASFWLQKEEGAVAIMFALCLPIFLALAAFSYDTGVQSYARTKMEYAADATALAVARYDPSNATTFGANIFKANFAQGFFGINVTPSISISADGTNITVTASSTMPTLMSPFLPTKKLTVKAKSVVQTSLTSLEVVMVLDVTGSMADSNKIGNLRTAANQFLSILFGQDTVSPTTRVSIVPFVASVNVGSAYTTWLTDPTTALLTSQGGQFPKGQPWKGCVGARASPYEETESPPSTAKWPTYFTPTTYVNASSKNDNDWTVDASGNVVIKTTSVPTVGPNRSCGPAIQPLTNKLSPLTALVNSLQPINGGGTFNNLGLAWGWRTISPLWKGLWNGGIDPLDYGTSNNRKVLVLETDGDNQWFNDALPPATGDPTAYGFGNTYATRLGLGKLGGATTISAAKTKIDSLVATMCQNIKNKGIEIYTVTFLVSSASTQSLYQNCASKTTNYYNITSSPNIVTAFNDIANKIKTIRIIQ